MNHNHIDIQSLMDKYNATGLSLAIIENRQVSRTENDGTLQAGTS